MRNTQRQHEIFRLVQKRGSCTISDLARELQVSGETIRRNVRQLSEEGLVVKTHGEISLPIESEEPPIMNRMLRMVEEKKRIADAVAAEVEDGDSLIIDTGSTTAFCAQALRNHSNLTVVTNSSYISNLLATRNGNRIFMTGGELRSHDAAAFGPSVIDFLRNFHTHKSILSIGAVHVTLGCMNYELCEAEFSRAVIAHSDYVIMATDASKFGKNGIAKVCDLAKIDMLVTDQVPSPKMRKQLTAKDVQLKVASQ
ncbi:MAG: DeoR/GlpR family DNA-binding transcription regulator [Gammaproteobacteria bacterium]|nr:DeoR/GlpR family DNA-binding transcription regulator [Gammaproteobacteria bacterium]